MLMWTLLEPNQIMQIRTKLSNELPQFVFLRSRGNRCADYLDLRILKLWIRRIRYVSGPLFLIKTLNLLGPSYLRLSKKAFITYRLYDCLINYEAANKLKKDHYMRFKITACLNHETLHQSKMTFSNVLGYRMIILINIFRDDYKCF